MPATVLVIEDNPDIRDLLRERLEAEGYRCLEAPDGAAGVDMVVRDHPDVVLLDVNLPAMNGLDVCSRLRQRPDSAHLPIIMVTARTDEIDRVVGLERGADDYVTKPFSLRELMLRIKAVLRRRDRPSAEPIRIGALEVDDGTREVRVSGEPVALRAKEFAILRALLEAEGQVLTRDQLLAGMRGGYAAGVDVRSRTVDVHIARLREKLGPEGRRIMTVQGAGYRFDLRPAPILD